MIDHGVANDCTDVISLIYTFSLYKDFLILPMVSLATSTYYHQFVYVAYLDYDILNTLAAYT